MVKDAKSTLIFGEQSVNGEQSDSQPYHGNYATMSYSRLVAPWFWPYPDYYTFLDYSCDTSGVYYNRI
jgi:hypothetical protein